MKKAWIGWVALAVVGLALLGGLGYVLKRASTFALYQQAQALRKAEQYKEAVEKFSGVIARDGKYLNAYVGRAAAYSKLQQHDLAARDITSALQLAPRARPPLEPTRLATLHVMRGFSCEKQGKEREAVADYQQAVTLDPDVRMAYNNLAWILATSQDATLRNGTQAVRYAEQACTQKQWKDPNSLDTLAAAYAETGDFANAVKWQQAAIDRATDSKKKVDYTDRLRWYKAGRACVE
ncbi:MAG: tetratricopeptide repeat protein [Armatimonadota bacterium]